MTDRLAHKELTAHIRGRLKAAGINARCRMAVICGERVIKVSTSSPDARFTDDEQRTIRLIAQVNHLSKPRGLPIDLDRMTDPHGAWFYMGYR